MVDLLQFGLEGFQVEILEHDDLVVRRRTVEYNCFGWGLFVSSDISLDTLQRQIQHACEALLEGLEGVCA